MTALTSDNSTILPPTGATPADWDNLDGHRFRCVHGQKRTIGGDAATVATSAIQLPDGSIDSGATIEPPLIFVSTSYGISTGQARELAVLLLGAVAEVEQWRDECGGDTGTVTA